jgi:transcription termination factor Rho
MAVLDRPELQASPLADLHAIADQLGLEGFRRLRKEDLIDAILGEGAAPASGSDASEDDAPASPRAGARSRAGAGAGADADLGAGSGDGDEPVGASRSRRRGSRSTAGGRRRASAKAPEQDDQDDGDVPVAAKEPKEGSGERGRARGRRSQPAAGESPAGEGSPATAEGVVELLGNGSAFLRLNPPETSDEDVYISAAQVRRCELVSGDRVSGPVRTPRRSERYPSLVRVDTINGASADAVSDGSRYEDLPVAFPSELLAFASKDPTLAAIERLTPLGRGSRAVIVGPPHSGKTETLKLILSALAAQEGLDLTLVLCGSRPEEIGEWREGPVQPAAALTFAASPDAQGQAVEQVLEVAKRGAVRKGHAVVLIDGLDGLHPLAARKALAAARNLREGGSVTVIATSTRAFGGESTVIALDPSATSAGREPALDLHHSWTLKPELLVGDRGAKAILKERAAAGD